MSGLFYHFNGSLKWIKQGKMNFNFKMAEYSFKLVIIIMACLLPEKRMARASKFLREMNAASPKKVNRR